MKYKISVFITILFLLSGIYLYPKNMGLSPGPKTLQEVRIGNVGEYSIFNLIAKEKGYFKKNGLDAEIVEYASGPPEISDLLAGKVDFAIAADFVGARNIFTNKDLRIISNVDNHEDFQMVVRKAAGINEPADFKGKRIGVTLKGAGEFFLGRYLSFNGINQKDVNILDLTPEQMTEQIEKGQIDACVVFNIHVYRIKLALGDRVDIWPIQRTRRIFATAYTTGTFIRNSPDLVTRYLKALTEAESYLKSDPAGGKQILENKMGYDSAFISYIWPKFDFNLSLSQEFLLALEDNGRFIIKNSLTSEKRIPDYLNYIYFESLNRAKPGSISIIH